MKKQLFCVLLTLIMVVGSIPLSPGTARAVEPTFHTDDPDCSCELCAAKTAAKSSLDTAAGDNPSALVSLLVRMAKADIDEAEDLQTVSAILDETLEALGGTVPADPGDAEGELLSKIRYSGVSLTLDSDISINFYMDLTEDAAQNGKMVFTVGNRTVNAERKNSENGTFFTCPLTALEMAETVRATFSYCGRTFVEDYSVAEYVTYILECKDENGNDYSDEMKTLAGKISNYGHYVQLYLRDIHKNVTIGDGGYAPITLYSDYDIDTDAVKNVLIDSFTVSEPNDDLEFFGRTVSFESSTALNYYLSVKNGKPLTSDMITCKDSDGTNRPFEIKAYQDNIYIVSVRDISASALDRVITVTVNDNFSLTGSVLDYCGAIISTHCTNDETTEKDVLAVNAITAFYEYFIAAGKYAGLTSVSFEMDGHGTQINRITGLEPGSLITRPADPAAEGYLFCGWYKDEHYNTEWDFDSDTASGPTTLYAKWHRLSSDTLYLDVRDFMDDISGIHLSLEDSEDPNRKYSYEMVYLGNGYYTDRGITEAYLILYISEMMYFTFDIPDGFVSPVFSHTVGEPTPKVYRLCPGTDGEKYSIDCILMQ